MRTHLLLAVLLAVSAAALAASAGAQTHQHGHPPAATAAKDAPAKGARQHQHSPGAAKDTRQLVKFSEPMRLHTIANMRDHLLALQEINEALSTNAFDKASTIAEQRLGMSSLALHGAHELAPSMPKGMQDIGTQMHRAASRLAVEAQNASVGNDVRPALAALGAVMQQCVACHATYRLH